VLASQEHVSAPRSASQACADQYGTSSSDARVCAFEGYVAAQWDDRITDRLREDTFADRRHNALRARGNGSILGLHISTPSLQEDQHAVWRALSPDVHSG